MTKKFKKTMWIGIKESWVSIAIIYFIRCVYLPAILALIWKIFRIDLTVYHSIIFVGTLILGPCILDAIWHCKDALKYEERNGCTLEEAWNATSTDSYNYDFDD